MALTPRELQALGKLKGTIVREFRAEFVGFLLEECWKIDALLRADAVQLQSVFGWEALPDGVRVIARQRLLYLVAQAPWIAGGQQIGGGWSTQGFQRALHHAGGAAVCAISGPQVTTLDGLLEHYATGLTQDLLAPAYEQWLETVARNTVKQIGAHRDEFATVRSNIHKQLQAEMIQLLVRQQPIAVGWAPDRTLKEPF